MNESRIKTKVGSKRHPSVAVFQTKGENSYVIVKKRRTEIRRRLSGFCTIYPLHDESALLPDIIAEFLSGGTPLAAIWGRDSPVFSMIE